MFICDECGRLEERLPEFKVIHQDPCGYEAYNINECKCGGIFVEAAKCPECGEWFNPQSTIYDICKQCRQKALTAFAMFNRGYSEAVKEFMNSYFDGETVFN